MAETEGVSFLRELSGEQFDVAVWTREAVLAADPDLVERVYRGWRGVGFRHPDAGYLCAIYPRSDWVVLHFEHGASMPDPDGILIGEGSQTRFLRIAEPDPALRGRIVAYVQRSLSGSSIARSSRPRGTPSSQRHLRVLEGLSEARTGFAPSPTRDSSSSVSEESPRQPGGKLRHARAG